MKRKYLIFPLALSSMILCLSGCSSSDPNTIVLRILNMEDYIYVNDPDSGYDDPDIYNETFIQYVRANYPEFDNYNISIVYDTTDTNETLYNELQTGKALYDLICPSDYMIQKLLSYDMLVELDKDLIPNYFGNEEHAGYASTYIKNTLDSITSKSYSKQTEYVVGDYSVGYMWGTLGLLFNPNYSMYAGIGEERVIEDMQYWKTLWDARYHGSFSIKDSMRDTYAVGIMQTYSTELYALKDKHDSGELSDSKYNEAISEIFNRCEENNVKEVEKTLAALKENSFGLEVDSGKQDIVTKKIGLNIAWSGDAVYSMDQAEDPEQVSNPFELCYAIPESGSNIWFDAWVIPNTSRTENQFKLANIFLNFLSDPAIASKNMDYTGYTSFIGGDSVLELVRDWYDYRTDLVYNPDDDYSSIFYVDPVSEELLEADYSDCHLESDNDETYDEVQLYYGACDYDEDGNLITIETGDPLTVDDLTLFEDEFYNSRFAMPDDIELVDLTYFFSGTLEEYSEEDMLFYSDCYLPYTTTNAEGEEVQNICVGRQFFCQYPNYETIVRCAVMKDYRENNSKIMSMWEEFKSDSLPTWAIIVFAVEGAILLGAVGFYFVNKKRKKQIRKNRKQ